MTPYHIHVVVFEYRLKQDFSLMNRLINNMISELNVLLCIWYSAKEVLLNENVSTS